MAPHQYAAADHACVQRRLPGRLSRPRRGGGAELSRAYQLEGLGAQLFERVEGDYFSVLGLPLLPLLAFLREHRIVAR
ncbi:MAG: Maf family protein [Hyphomonadaceae bacterium]